MKRCLAFLFAFTLVLALNLCSAEVRINEVMYDLNGSDTNREWIEIYNSGPEPVNISSWKFYEANTKHTLSLKSGTTLLEPNNYALIIQDLTTFLSENNITSNIFESSFSLDNSGEQLALWNGSDYLGNFTYNVSIGGSGDGKSIQFYNNSWQACVPTPGAANNCTQINTTAPTNTTANNTNSSNNASIYLELNWNNSKIISNQDFEIDVSAYNLQNYDYDLKLWLEFKENNTVISERYDDDNSKWESGIYYIEKVFTGSGNKTETIKLRLKSEYKDFYGDVNIFGRLRKYDTGASVADSDDTIEILEKTDSSSDTSSNDNSDNASISLMSQSPNSGTEAEVEVIRLGNSTKSLNSNATTTKNQNSIIYKSKNEYIKEYAPYAFCLLCIFIIVLLLTKKI